MAARSAGAQKRRPLYKEVEEQESRRVGNRARASRAKRRQRLRRRYAVVYDIEGPRVRLGLLWFVVALMALAVGPLPTALVYGGAAATAGAQAARVWRRNKARPNEVVAAGMAGAMTIGACLGAGPHVATVEQRLGAHHRGEPRQIGMSQLVPLGDQH
ncbi:MAG: hypothetical protein ABL966_10765, partial [Acidimicrobiales bacterium]